MILSIDAVLGRISDPRVCGQVEHALPALLKLILLGKLCGRVTLKSAWRMSRRLPKSVLKRLGFVDGRAPCYSTVTETFKALDADEVRLVLATAVRGLGLEDGDAVAIDGKVLRGSGHDEAAAVTLLAAFSTRLEGVIGEVQVGDDTNEITAMLDLLDQVDVAGLVLTGDAAFAQKKICRKINDKNADYVFTVKDNQKTLRKRIKATTNAAKASLSP